MSLIGLLIFVIIVGLLFYLISLLPLPAPFKTIVLVLFIIIVIVWLASSVGFLGPGTLRIGR